MENIVARKRTSSLSRSSDIEKAINILKNLIRHDFDLDEISTLVINNKLQNEFRTIAWRLFLKIPILKFG